MSASITPTVKPVLASCAARFTVTEDLPTPPLPDAMASTRVMGGTCVGRAPSRAWPRARSITLAFSAAFSSSQIRRTSLTPGIASTRASTSCLMVARSGQPAVVNAMVMSTRSPIIFAPRTMPRSTMLSPSSGSITPLRTAMTSSARTSTSVPAIRLFYLLGSKSAASR